MKSQSTLIRKLLPLILAGSLALLACSLFTPSKSRATPTVLPQAGSVVITATPNAAAEPSSTPQASESTAVSATQAEAIDTPQPAATFDISTSGLPAGFPIYPGAHDISGLAGMMVKFTVDKDVATVSKFYLDQLKAAGWTALLAGGQGVDASCGGDCGPGNPTVTPTSGPTPTATPPGWMTQNTQMWMSGTKQVMILFTTNAKGGTDVVITVLGK